MARIDPHLVISHKFPEASTLFSLSTILESELDRLISLDFVSSQATYRYTERDAALYALGIGACATDALDGDELRFVYHEDGQQFVKVFPTFAALVSLEPLGSISAIPGIEFDPRLLLHGQQYIELYRPIQSNGSLQVKTSIAGLHDKGKAAILEIEILCYDRVSGQPIFMNSPFSYSKDPAKQAPVVRIPKSEPFAVFEDGTLPSQALLYRLSGDYNPLHSDPIVAKVAGFSRPILHGLCTLGFAVRAVIRCICRGEPDMVKSISGRFLLHVFPGETLVTEMWLDGLRVLYQVKVKERNKAVLSGHVDLHRLSSRL